MDLLRRAGERFRPSVVALRSTGTTGDRQRKKCSVKRRES